MGCDAGFIPSRGEQVRVKKAPEQAQQHEHALARWRLCTLSKHPLKNPVVVGPLGRLFNKEALLEAMVFKTLPEEFSYIQRKDVLTLNLKANPALEKGDSDDVAPFVCPITLVGLGCGVFKAMVPCGCVFSERGLKEMRGAKNSPCIGCRTIVKRFQDMNPPLERQKELRLELETKRERRRQKKKGKEAARPKRAEPEEEVEPKEIEPAKAKRRKHAAELVAVAKHIARDISIVKSVAEQGKGVHQERTKSDVYRSMFSPHRKPEYAPREFHNRSAYHRSGT